jgi:hypothetical protein
LEQQCNPKEFLHPKETGSHKEKRVVGITTLIAILAGITYGIVSNNETTKNLTKLVEETSDKIILTLKIGKGPYPF